MHALRSRMNTLHTNLYNSAAKFCHGHERKLHMYGRVSRVYVDEGMGVIQFPYSKEKFRFNLDGKRCFFELDK